MKSIYSCQGLIPLVLVLGHSLAQPLNNTTGEQCSTNDQCISGKICVDLKCVDPCQGVCGLNTVCTVQDLLPICSCKTGYDGDPFKECKPTGVGECTQNAQCSLDEACINQRCLDPCQGGCGLNTDCRVVNHRPLCACLRGFVFSPDAGCKSVSMPECQTNIHCPEDRACRQQKCVDPCEERVCGNNTLCHVKNHYPVCVCKVGYLGDALHECVPLCSTRNNDKVQDNKTFVFIDDAKSWYDAFDDCKSRGMKLATINNEKEWNEFVRASKAAGSWIWLGGNDLGRYKTFFWVSTGTTLSYTNWDTTEPSGLDYHCLKVGISFKWISSSCISVANYACESIK